MLRGVALLKIYSILVPKAHKHFPISLSVHFFLQFYPTSKNLHECPEALLEILQIEAHDRVGRPGDVFPL